MKHNVKFAVARENVIMLGIIGLAIGFGIPGFVAFIGALFIIIFAMSNMMLYPFGLQIFEWGEFLGPVNWEAVGRGFHTYIAMLAVLLSFYILLILPSLMRMASEKMQKSS